MLPRWRRVVFVLALVALAACLDEPTRPAVPGDSGSNDGASRTPSRVLGLVEVTISGIGTDQMTSYAISARNLEKLARLRALREAGVSDAAGDGASALDPGARYAFTLPSNSDDSGDGTIQLELLSTGSFTHGERGNGGYRYLYATYRVRNAQEDGTPYDRDLRNLTFVAVKATSPDHQSIRHTPVSKLKRFDGSDADEALATQFIPTGAVMQTRGGAIEPRFPDMLQVFKEEAADILNLATVAGLEIEDVFPYGFVVSNATTDETRWLPANPAEGDFHGLVTFAYKVPLQADPKDDPFTVTIRFLAVEDSEVKITQSIEEVTPAGIKAFDERVATL